MSDFVFMIGVAKCLDWIEKYPRLLFLFLISSSLRSSVTIDGRNHEVIWPGVWLLHSGLDPLSFTGSCA